MNSYEEDIRAKLIYKLMEDEKVSKNHDVILNRYNCILGDINRYSSDVYFIDAYKVLKEIDEIIESNIEISILAIQPNFPKRTMKYFFHSIRQTCLFSSDFYNNIILKRKDLTVNSRINDCAISVD